MNENENENAKEVKTKVQRVKWILNKEELTLSLEGITLDLKDTVYPELSKIDKYVYIYGIKQSCSDSGAGIKDYELRKKAVMSKFDFFILKDLDFLPSGRVKLTPEQKAENKAKKVSELVEQMISGGMSEEMAISIAKKTFK